MVSSFEVTVPPLRSGAKIGSFLTNFQAFCSYYFHFGPNSLSGWEILFVKQDSRAVGWLIPVQNGTLNKNYTAGLAGN